MTVDAHPLPRPSKYAGNAVPERDAAILRMAAAGADYARIGQAVGMKPSNVQKRLYTLRERIADEAEERARKHPGFPKHLPCPTCRTERLCQWPGDRHCAGCKDTPAWRAGDGVRGTVAGIRRGRG